MVFVDGKPIYDSDVIVLDSEIQQLSVSVKDMAAETNGDSTDDDAAWGNARLVK